MTTLTRSEEAAARYFRDDLRLTVVRLQSDDEETPDFEVDGDGAGYLVEVKGRLLAERLRRVAPLDVQSVSQDMNFDRGVLDHLIKARGQCRSRDPLHERLWIVWLAPEDGVHPGAQIDRINNTLVGVRTAWDLDAIAGKRPCEIVCYYAKPCAFEKVPEVDAVVIQVPANAAGEGSPEAQMLLVNEFGARVPTVLSSRLAADLNVDDILPSRWMDPRPSVRSCIVPFEVDRADEVAVRQVVCTALKVQRLVFPAERQWIGMTAIRRSDIESL